MVVDSTKLLRLVVEELLQQLEMAHANAFPGGCDGGCSYEISMDIARDALVGIVSPHIDPAIVEGMKIRD